MKTTTCKDTKEIVSNYKDYLKTRHWLKLRAEFKQKTKVKRCVMCGYDKMLNIHHTTYENLGNETIDDLVYLCKYCHYKLHNSVGTIDTKVLKELRTVEKKREKLPKPIKSCSKCVDYKRKKCVIGYVNKNNSCEYFRLKLKNKKENYTYR